MTCMLQTCDMPDWGGGVLCMRLTSDSALAYIPPPCKHPFLSFSQQTWSDDDREELQIGKKEGGALFARSGLRTNLS